MKAVVLLLIAVVCINAKFLHTKSKPSDIHALQRSKRDVKADDNYCPAYSCVSNGGTCDLFYNFCGTSSYCKGADLRGDPGVCTASIADGQACTDSSSCAGQYSYCANAVCTAATFAATVGQTCDGLITYCTSDLVCNASDTTAGICIQLNTTGGSCAEYGACVGASFCDSTFNCVALFTTAVGGSCFDTPECVVGSWCTSDGIAPGTCMAAVTASNAKCTSDSQCPSPQGCAGCPVNTKGAATGTCEAPFVYTSTNAADLSAYYTCQATSNCASNFCFSQCKNEICAWYHDFFTQYPSALPCGNDISDLASNCGVDAPSTSTSDAACLNPTTMICAFAIAAMASL